MLFKGSTCLVEACLNRDMGMIDLLLKYGARDDDCKVGTCTIYLFFWCITIETLKMETYKM